MNKLKTKLDIVYNDSVKKDIIIVHISDIHFNVNISSKKLKKISDYIIKIKPDYIMITGDLIDEDKIINNKDKIKELLVFLTNLAKNAKVLISLGNHDIFKDEDYKFFNKINDLYNIYVLNNISYQDEFIYVSGLTLTSEYYYNITENESEISLLKILNNNSQIINKLPKEKPKVLLIHSPIKLNNKEVIDKLKEYDLILSGHTHGGMVPSFLGPIFKNRGIISPRKRFFEDMMRGKIEIKINNKKITIIINDSITRLSRYSSVVLCKINFIYNISINKIIIRRILDKKINNTKL